MGRNNFTKKLTDALLTCVIVATALFILNYYLSMGNTTSAVAATPPTESIPDKVPVSNSAPAEPFPAENQYCLTCHQGIEPTRSLQSGMMTQIMQKGAEMDDPNGCVVCHGGNPNETINKTKAHSGKPVGSKLAGFTPVPGALQVNENTCGLCHGNHTYNVHLSNMNTDAGKMKAILWSWGIGTENHDHIYADHQTKDTDGPTPRSVPTPTKPICKSWQRIIPVNSPTN